MITTISALLISETNGPTFRISHIIVKSAYVLWPRITIGSMPFQQLLGS